MKMIINDALHGAITLEEPFVELVKTQEFQRLKWVRQLGLALVVFPGANHTRFEHSLGCYHLARKICEQLDIESSEVLVAALLHDIGHGPFSHVTERFLGDHVERAKAIIKGEEGIGFEIPEILENHGIDTQKVLNILDEKEGVLSQIISSAIDADRMDYLKRDAFFSGVSYGNINEERLITLMEIEGDKIVFHEKALDAIEDFFVARMHMYRTVYGHHTKRIADLMLREAVKKAGLEKFWYYTDGQLLEELRRIKASKPWVEDIIFRRLFKRAVEVRELKKRVEENALKEEIVGRAGVKEEDVIVYVAPPRKSVKKRSVFVRGGIDVLEESSLLRALSRMYQWPVALGIYTREKYRDKVRDVAVKVLEDEGVV